jgi:hypothetical protein
MLAPDLNSIGAAHEGQLARKKLKRGHPLLQSELLFRFRDLLSEFLLIESRAFFVSFPASAIRGAGGSSRG